MFVTEYRRKAITDKMMKRSAEIMRAACTDFEAELKQFNGEEDHMHPLYIANQKRPQAEANSAHPCSPPANALAAMEPPTPTAVMAAPPARMTWRRTPPTGRPRRSPATGFIRSVPAFTPGVKAVSGLL
ncbi:MULTISPECIES: transposase [unclassified Streptomyces]|uniref:Transposase n=1 Tax=Streptomyces sp. NBC_00119 TaxID=2975659 RepID=A0AAU1U958_9ACTN|nr:MULTISPECIES: transposase [unclassified Streptomyces]MCX4644282.1 transposase [Streptomyces sp. NBC_01446]MCX5325394.1 transposase [Streptomyces sp. NBC_00120]